MVNLIKFLKKVERKQKFLKSRKKKANKAIVEKILREIFKKSAVFETQKSLLSEVRNRLKKIDPELSVGPKRLRKILYEMKFVKIKVKLRKTKKRIKTKCPICGSPLKEWEVVNLRNEKVKIGYKCVKCGFKIRKEGYVPIKYSFVKVTQ